jgi:hypothetical protein
MTRRIGIASLVALLLAGCGDSPVGSGRMPCLEVQGAQGHPAPVRWVEVRNVPLPLREPRTGRECDVMEGEGNGNDFTGRRP